MGGVGHLIDRYNYNRKEADPRYDIVEKALLNEARNKAIAIKIHNQLNMHYIQLEEIE